MSTLSKEKIREYLQRPQLEERLIITPIFNLQAQLSDGAIDVRLGNQFILPQRTALSGINPVKDDLSIKVRQYENRITVGLKEPFVLHPKQLVLGSTLEYILLPNDLSAYVLSRSSWGRLGLVIATATFVNPGFKGCLTLEMENLGEVPLTLYPGLRIAQLIFHTLEGNGDYGNKRSYFCPIAPQFPKIHNDEELGFWTPKG